MSQTAAITPARSTGLVSLLVLGFIAGAIAVIAFHQPALYLLNEIGFVSATVYPTTPAAVTGIPQIASTAFWGGLWGVVLALAQTRFPRGVGYWLLAVVFGALLPSLGAWFIVPFLKGLPLAAGGDLYRLATGLIVNGAWGFGTGLLLRLAGR